VQRPKSVFEMLRPYLIDRADEVLEAAKRQYPKETEAIAHQLLRLIEIGKLDKIDGPSLYNLFKSLGLKVRLETKVVYIKRGEAKDLAEMLRQGLK